MPDNFIPLILQNFHQLQRTRYTCDLLDQLCLFVSTYYHLHLSFPHQYPTRETSLKTTKQQPKIMNCVPKYDSFWQLWESSPNNPISTSAVTIVPRLSLLAKVSERNKENFVVHIYWSNLPKTVLCSAGVVFVGAEDSYTKSKNFTSYTILVAKSVFCDFHSKKTMQRLRHFFDEYIWFLS